MVGPSGVLPSTTFDATRHCSPASPRSRVVTTVRARARTLPFPPSKILWPTFFLALLHSSCKAGGDALPADREGR